MSTIRRLDKNDYKNIKHLFKDIPFGWDVIFNAALEYGFVLADDHRQPKVALVFLGGCIVYGGDATHSTARDLVSAMKIQPLILVHSEAWLTLIKNVYGEKVKIETRYHLPFKSLDQEKLYSVDLSFHEGYRLERINEGIAAKLKEQIGEEYQIYHYSSLKDLHL